MTDKKIKVMTVFGTRPEAIKMAPVVLELAKHPDKIVPVVAVTAQHREMLDQVLNLFRIKPDYDLDIMAAGQTLFDITSRAMAGLDKVLKHGYIISCEVSFFKSLEPSINSFHLLLKCFGAPLSMLFRNLISFKKIHLTIQFN